MTNFVVFLFPADIVEFVIYSFKHVTYGDILVRMILSVQEGSANVSAFC